MRFYRVSEEQNWNTVCNINKQTNQQSTEKKKRRKKEQLFYEIVVFVVAVVVVGYRDRQEKEVSGQYNY